jgi:hypothetical protein
MAAHDEHMAAKLTNDGVALLTHLDDAQDYATLAGEAAAKAKVSYEAAQTMK